MFRKKVRLVLTASLLSICACGISCNEPALSASGGARQISITRTSEGAILTEIYTTTAVISAIDRATRMVTLSTPDGQTTAFKAQENFRPFDQLAVGDLITAQIWEELAVYIQNGIPTAPAEPASAPQGARSGGLQVAWTEQTATIIALDRDTRQATLQFADRRWRSFQVGENIDLAKLNVGDKIPIRHAGGAAIFVHGKSRT